MTNLQIIAQNKRVRFDYEIIETFEAGIVLKGTEIKSIRDRKVELRDSYIVVQKGEFFWINGYIAVYSHGNINNHDPERSRKLLLNKSEMAKLIRKKEAKGLSIVPSQVYLKNGLAKIKICLGRGKKQYDKRQDIRAKDQRRELARMIKRKN